MIRRRLVGPGNRKGFASNPMVVTHNLRYQGFKVEKGINLPKNRLLGRNYVVGAHRFVVSMFEVLDSVAARVSFAPGPEARTEVEWKIVHASHTGTHNPAKTRRIGFPPHQWIGVPD